MSCPVLSVTSGTRARPAPAIAHVLLGSLGRPSQFSFLAYESVSQLLCLHQRVWSPSSLLAFVKGKGNSAPTASEPTPGTAPRAGPFQKLPHWSCAVSLNHRRHQGCGFPAALDPLPGGRTWTAASTPVFPSRALCMRSSSNKASPQERVQMGFWPVRPLWSLGLQTLLAAWRQTPALLEPPRAPAERSRQQWERVSVRTQASNSHQTHSVTPFPSTSFQSPATEVNCQQLLARCDDTEPSFPSESRRASFCLGFVSGFFFCFGYILRNNLGAIGQR